MAKTQINYGTKKMVAKTQFKKPIYALADTDAQTLKNGLNGYNEKPNVSIKKCYCADCQKTFDTNIDIKIDQRNYNRLLDVQEYAPNRLTSSDNDFELTQTSQNDIKIKDYCDISFENGTKISINKDNQIPKQKEEYSDNDIEIECPECGNKQKLLRGIVLRQPAKSVGEKNNPTAGAWVINSIPDGIYTYQFETNDGAISRVENNTMMTNTIVYPSVYSSDQASGKKAGQNKTFSWKEEISEIVDLKRHSITKTLTKIQNGERTLESTISPVDAFEYSTADRFSSAENHGIKNKSTARTNSTLSDAVKSAACVIYPGDKAIVSETDKTASEFKNENKYPSTTLFSYPSKHEITNDNILTDAGVVTMAQSLSDAERIKFLQALNKGNQLTEEAILSQFKEQEPLMMHPEETELYKVKHRKGEVIADNSAKKATLMTMMVKYPLAVEHALGKKSMREKNFEFDEKRKQQADPNYQIKEIPTSAKSKILREEIGKVYEQLFPIDDKVLGDIRTAKDMDDLTAKLRYYVFGESDNSTKPTSIKLKNDHPVQEAIKSSKTLKKMFNENPIAMASNAYTCHKLGINEPSRINQMMMLAENHKNEFNEKANASGKHIKGTSDDTPADNDIVTNSGVLAPVRRKNDLRFIKSYAKHHNDNAFVEIYNNTDSMRLLYEAEQLFGNLANSATFVAEESTNEVDRSEIQLYTFRRYIEKNSIEQAYVDYTSEFGDQTFEKVNELAKKVKQENILDKAKTIFDSEGLDKALETYPEIKDWCEKPEDTLTNFVHIKDRKPRVSARDSKPLFDRSLQQVHDELSEMQSRITTENKEIPYSEKDLELQRTYEVPKEHWLRDYPEGQTPTWSFKPTKDTFDIISLATELSNCSAGSQYLNKAVTDRAKYFYMEDENGKRIAEIELKKHGEGRYSLEQFQAAHDVSMGPRYKDICMQWLEDCNINVNPEIPDVKKMGLGLPIYGNGNTDFHHEEIDFITNKVVSVEENKRRAQARVTLAENLYGKDANGNINVPKVPSELEDLAFS